VLFYEIPRTAPSIPGRNFALPSPHYQNGDVILKEMPLSASSCHTIG